MAILINRIECKDAAKVVKIARSVAIAYGKIVLVYGGVFVGVETALMFEEKPEFLIVKGLAVGDGKGFTVGVAEADAEARSSALFLGCGFAAVDGGAVGNCTLERAIYAKSRGVRVFYGDVFPMAIPKKIEHKPFACRSVKFAGSGGGVDGEIFEATVFQINCIARV